MRDLPRIVAETEIGKSVTVKVLRKGKEVSVTAEVGRLEDGEKIVAAQSGQTAPATAPACRRHGSRHDGHLDDAMNCAPSSASMPTSRARSSPKSRPMARPPTRSLQPGDVITEAGEKEVTGAADIAERVKEAEAAKKNSVLCWSPRAASRARCVSSR